MTLTHDNETPPPAGRVTASLAPADWGGLLVLALTILSICGAILYKVHEIAQTNRERLSVVETRHEDLKDDVAWLRDEVRDRRGGD